MTVEQREDGLWWENHNISISWKGPFPDTYHFFEEGEEQLRKRNGKKEWIVGMTDESNLIVDYGGWEVIEVPKSYGER